MLDIADWYSVWLDPNNPVLNIYQSQMQKFIQTGVSNSKGFGSQSITLKNIATWTLLHYFAEELYEYNIDVQKYTAQKDVYPIVTIPGRVGFSPMLEILYQWAYKIGGSGSDFLSLYSKRLNLTRAQISTSTALIKWFGCFSPNANIPDSKGIFSTTSLQKECDPLFQYATSINI